MKIRIVMVACAVLCFATGAQAYIVQNSSFESPALTGSPWYTNGVITNWLASGGSFVDGVLHVSLSTGIPTPPTGNQWLWLGPAWQAPWIPGAASQYITTVVDNQNIDISFYAGTRGDNAQATLAIRLYSWDGAAWHLLTWTTVLTPATQGSAFHNITLNTGTGHSGEDLWVQFGWGGGGQALVDDVTIIPEPATIGLMGLGLAACFALRKGTGRKKRQ